MLEELNEWFVTEAGGQGGALTCEAIMGPDMTRTPQKKCGALVAGAFVRVMEILSANGFDPTDPNRTAGA
jgi:hypothetical protein